MWCCIKSTQQNWSPAAKRIQRMRTVGLDCELQTGESRLELEITTTEYKVVHITHPTNWARRFKCQVKHNMPNKSRARAHAEITFASELMTILQMKLTRKDYRWGLVGSWPETMQRVFSSQENREKFIPLNPCLYAAPGNIYMYTCLLAEQH